MKTGIKSLFLRSALVAGFGLILSDRVTAQTFTNLHSFTALSPGTFVNSDGANPQSGLILSGNTLYGTASEGGISRAGTVFAINTDGTDFRPVYYFATGGGGPGGVFTNADGASPAADFILSGNTLYGTTSSGGLYGSGTVFSINTSGGGFRILHTFTATVGLGTNTDGANPSAGLILSGNTLYGTASGGGFFGIGAVFAVSTDGLVFSNLYNFADSGDEGNPNGLILSSNTLYGATSGVGDSESGTVFAISTNGTGFTNVYIFTGGDDGANPAHGLVLSGSTLYGTATSGGTFGDGTVFAVNTNGMGFTNLYEFEEGDDGARPSAGLILSGNTLYGTAKLGGSSDLGSVFAINTDGTGFTTLHGFFGASDGERPAADLILSGNTLYGTAFSGGSAGNGTIFGLTLGAAAAPQITVVQSAANLVITWPTNTALTLQSSSNLGSAAVWTSNSPPPVVVNGQNTVTNPISGAQMFFRLSQ